MIITYKRRYGWGGGCVRGLNAQKCGPVKIIINSHAFHLMHITHYLSYDSCEQDRHTEASKIMPQRKPSTRSTMQPIFVQIETRTFNYLSIGSQKIGHKSHYCVVSLTTNFAISLEFYYLFRRNYSLFTLLNCARLTAQSFLVWTFCLHLYLSSFFRL